MNIALGDPRLPARFWAKVQVDEYGCWLWTGALRPKGYGYFNPCRKGATCLAYRAAYIALVGEVPDGLQLDHLCRVRRCVNPAHLEAVTPSVNVLRADHANRRKTHCIHGHPFDATNTRYRPCGRRDCLACKRDRHARDAQRAHHLPDLAA